VESALISVRQAVTIQAATNFAAGGVGAVAEGAIKGQPATTKQVLTAAAGSTAGGLAGSGVAAVAGDFAGPAAKGILQRLGRSSAPGANNIASTTASTGVAIPRQSVSQALGSQVGQGAVAAAVDVTQKDWKENESYSSWFPRVSGRRNSGAWSVLFHRSTVQQPTSISLFSDTLGWICRRLRCHIPG
jgi:hypothetical protein